MKTLYVLLKVTTLFVFVVMTSACGREATMIPSVILSPSVVSPTVPATGTKAPKPTHPPISTLPLILQDEFYELLKSNGNCDLPCFLGIIPGKTSWDEVKADFTRFLVSDEQLSNSYIDKSGFESRSFQITTTNAGIVMVRMELAVDNNGIVQHLVVHLDAMQDGFTVFEEPNLEFFSIAEVISREGVPDDIYLSIRKQYESASIFLVYKNKKLVALYTATAPRNEVGKYEICPVGLGNYSSTMVLASPTDPVDVKTLFAYPFYINNNPQDFDLIRLSELDTRSFHEFIQTGVPGCHSLLSDY